MQVSRVYLAFVRRSVSIGTLFLRTKLYQVISRQAIISREHAGMLENILHRAIVCVLFVYIKRPFSQGYNKDIAGRPRGSPSTWRCWPFF